MSLQSAKMHREHSVTHLRFSVPDVEVFPKGSFGLCSLSLSLEKSRILGAFSILGVCVCLCVFKKLFYCIIKCK